MTVRAILAGAIAKPPVSKVGKSGKPFAILSVRETGIEPARWWSAILFGDGVQDVLRLGVGDPIALAGRRRDLHARGRRASRVVEVHGGCGSDGAQGSQERGAVVNIILNPTKCAHPARAVRHRPCADGSDQFWDQCLDCGAAVGAPISRAVACAQGRKPEAFDELIRERGKRLQRKEKAGRARRSAQGLL